MGNHRQKTHHLGEYVFFPTNFGKSKWLRLLVYPIPGNSAGTFFGDGENVMTLSKANVGDLE